MKRIGIIATIIALMLLLVTFASANGAPVLTVSGCKTDTVEDNSYTCTVTATDPDADVLTFSLTDKPDGMTIGSSTGVITWTPDEEQIGSHTIIVKVTDDDATPLSDEETFTIFVRPESVCGDYDSGSDLRITDVDIENDNEDDEDFYPGDTINIDVDVENEGDDEVEDVTVEAILYDTTESEILDSAKSDEFDLDEDDKETSELTLEVPKDVDTDDDIILFVSVYEDGNDDENCNWEKNDDLELQRRKHDITINQITLTPETVKAGKTVEAKIYVENVGDRDEENSYIKIENSELKIDKKSEIFNTDSYEDGDDDEYTTTLTLTIPADAKAGEYDLEIYVYDEDNNLYDSGSTFATLTVEATTTLTPTTTGTATITVEGAPEKVEPGKAVSIPVKVTNTASENKEYSIILNNIGDWAESTSVIDAYLTPGQTSTYYLTIIPKTDATEGQHSATVIVKEGTTTITTKTLSLTIPEEPEPQTTGGTVVDIPEDKGVFQNIFSGTTFWIIGDLVLVLVAVFFIKMLFSKKEE